MPAVTVPPKAPRRFGVKKLMKPMLHWPAIASTAPHPTQRNHSRRRTRPRCPASSCSRSRISRSLSGGTKRPSSRDVFATGDLSTVRELLDSGLSGVPRPHQDHLLATEERADDGQHDVRDDKPRKSREHVVTRAIRVVDEAHQQAQPDARDV